MPPPLPDPEIDDEDYASSEDSDFAPDEVGGEGVGDGESIDSDEEEEGKDDTTTTKTKAASKGRKRKQAGDGDDDDAGFENSGDEAIIEKGKKRRKKGQQQARADAEDEEGGEGGLIKTRSMRAVECVLFPNQIPIQWSISLNERTNACMHV